MPKPPKPVARNANYLPQSTLIIDNGAYTMKAGFAPMQPFSDSDALSNCHIIPNALVQTRDKRIYVASQLDSQVSQWNEALFRRPVERGQLVSWEAQKEIWDHTFFNDRTAKGGLLVKEPGDTTLILTEAPNTMPALQKNADEIIMEEWGFGGYARVIGPSLNAFNDLHPLFGDTVLSAPSAESTAIPLECLLVIDSGFSQTTITPLYRGRPLQRAIRRLDLGGNHLTNLLKESISVRHVNLSQDVKVVNDVKEDICFVSQDFKSDMEKSWKGNFGKRAQLSTPPLEEGHDDMDIDAPVSNSSIDHSLLVDYILPDGVRIPRGFSRPYDPLAAKARKKQAGASLPEEDHATMTLGVERFATPEIIFSPSDVGSIQPGIAELTFQSLSVLPPALRASMLANILVVGGNAKIKGFVERVQNEVRMLAPVELVVRARSMEDPVTSTWLGGARMAQDQTCVKSVGITKKEYQEHGAGWVAKKFAGGIVGK